MTSVLDSIKASFPSQYYAAFAGGVITSAIDVWNGVDLTGRHIDVLKVPSASTLISLTENQFNLMKIKSFSGINRITVTNGVIDYPDRFYVTSDKPCVSYDMWGYSTITGLPSASSLNVVTSEAFSDRLTRQVQQYFDTTTKTLVDYTPPAPIVTLVDKASSALIVARTYVYDNFGMFNEPTPDAWVTYLKALVAIVKGTDTTSTELPTQPSE